MSHDRRRPAQPNPIIDPSERLILRVSTPVENKPAIRTDSGRLAAEVVQLLRNGGFDCGLLVDASEDEAPRRLH
jgi:hypothetical protein